MGKARARPEIYLLLNNGLKAEDLIRRGIPVTTAYAYSGRYKKHVAKDFEKLLKMVPCSDEQLATIMMSHKSKYAKRLR